MNHRVSVIIPAAGSSRRMGDVNKLMLNLDGIPVLARTLITFSQIPEVSEIIITTRESDILQIGNLVKDYGIHKIKAIIPGGDTRQKSVALGLNQVTEPIVLIHDGARPMVLDNTIRNVIDALKTYDAAAPAVAVKDTIKKIDENGLIIDTPNRDCLVQIQTPQGFKTELIRNAHKNAEENGISVTDDCALAELMNIPVCTVAGDYTNVKITTPEDISVCEGFLRR